MPQFFIVREFDGIPRKFIFSEECLQEPRIGDITRFIPSYECFEDERQIRYLMVRLVMFFPPLQQQHQTCIDKVYRAVVVDKPERTVALLQPGKMQLCTDIRFNKQETHIRLLFLQLR